MRLLVNNIHTKISNELLFISCPSTNAPPICLWLVSKMTNLIDMHVHTYGIRAKNTITLERASFQITKQAFKPMLKEVWSQSPSSACFLTGFQEPGLCRQSRLACFSLVLKEFNVCFRPSRHGNLQHDALRQNIESGATKPFVPALVLQSVLLFHSSFNSVFVRLPRLVRPLDFKLTLLPQ